ALELFAIDFAQPEKLDPRLTLLGPEAIAQWRAGLLELLITIAQAEINLAVKDKADDVRDATQRSFQRVQQAERMGLVSQPALFLQADLQDLLGRTDVAQSARE